MAIIVENGSIVADANSYVSVQEVKQYLDARGFHKEASSHSLPHLVLLACDYLETINWKGEKVEATQPLAWPRRDLYVQCSEIPDDTIPQAIKTAQILLVLVQATGIDLMPVTGTQDQLSKTIGRVSVTYGKGGRTSPYVHQVSRLLSLYTLSSVLKTVRA